MMRVWHLRLQLRQEDGTLDEEYDLGELEVGPFQEEVPSAQIAFQLALARAFEHYARGLRATAWNTDAARRQGR